MTTNSRFARVVEQSSRDHTAEVLADLTEAELTQLVCKAIKQPEATIVDTDCKQIQGGASGSKVFKLSGKAKAGHETVDWSLFLKILDKRTDRHQLGDATWEREALLYESDLLNDLPGGLRVPSCFLVDRKSTSEIWLWMEDVSESSSAGETLGHMDMAPWPLERYGQVAYCLGRLNGAYLTDRPLPTHRWLFSEYERMPQLWASVDGAASIDLIGKSHTHPLVQQLYPPDVISGLAQLWQEREVWLANLYDHLPQTFGHLDAARVNLLARRLPDGTDELFAIDWQLSGIGGIGQELTPLVLVTLMLGNVGVEHLLALERIAFAGYADGLRDAGWDGDLRMARYGYIALAGISWALRRFSGMVEYLIDEEKTALMESFTKRPISESIESWSILLEHMINLADEGRDLARELF